MSSSGVDRPILERPPAATAGSPGTAIFSPPTSQSTRPVYCTGHPLSSTSHLNHPRPISPPSSVKPDRIPVQWSFESSYGLFGAFGGAALPPPPNMMRKESRESSGVLSGGWFGRKKNRDKAGKGKTKAQGDRSRSVDAPMARMPRDSSSPNVSLAHVVTPPPSPGLPAKKLEVATAISPPARPSRSPLRPPSAPVTPTTPVAEMAPEIANERVILNETLSKLVPTRTDTTSTPLTSVPASNAPTSRPSRSPSPNAAGSRSHPPPSFRPTSSHRPGSSSGFKPTQRTVTPASTSKSGPPTTARTQRRRPVTSSGIPALQDVALLSKESLGVYSAGTGPSVTAARGSRVSLTPSTVPSTVPSISPTPVARKETASEAAKRRMEARQKGFIMKGGKRHHPRPREEAPYPRDFERKTTDYDVWEHLFSRDLAKGITFHDFTTPPTKVLDLGCGTGEWILDCAREWQDTQFVGLDLVPIQPNLTSLTSLGQGSLASRIQWVVGNLLEPLPFSDGEFDFVHVRRVARGVPEDRWDSVFDEVTRVLKGGGAFEMLEEDLFFPGSINVGDEGEGGNEEKEVHERGRKLPPTPPLTTPSPSPHANETLSHQARASESMVTTTKDSGKKLRRSNSDRSSTRTGPRSSPSSRWPDMQGRTSETDTPPPRLKNLALTHAHVERGISSTLSEVLPRMSLDSWRAHRPAVVDIIPRPGEIAGDANANEGLFHAYTNPVMNPRDHSVLESAYDELHAARFINLAPLSVLNSALVVHFKDVRSHAPIQLAFPSVPVQRSVKNLPEPQPTSLFTTPPSRPSSSSSGTSSRVPTSNRQSSTNDKSDQPVFRQRLYDQSQRLVVLDRLHPLGMATAYSETTRPPNKQWNFDVSALHMHLSARVAEVLACAEEMWEFIVECRRSPVRWRDPGIAALAEVSREEWEDCLMRFEMDMQDKIDMRPVMSDRLSWSVRATPRTPERKAFDEAVKKWEMQQKVREEEDPCSDVKKSNARPLSRVLRVFVGWKH